MAESPATSVPPPTDGEASFTHSGFIPPSFRRHSGHYDRRRRAMYPSTRSSGRMLPLISTITFHRGRSAHHRTSSCRARSTPNHPSPAMHIHPPTLSGRHRVIHPHGPIRPSPHRRTAASHRCTTAWQADDNPPPRLVLIVVRPAGYAPTPFCVLRMTSSRSFDDVPRPYHHAVQLSPPPLSVAAQMFALHLGCHVQRTNTRKPCLSAPLPQTPLMPTDPARLPLTTHPRRASFNLPYRPPSGVNC